MVYKIKREKENRQRKPKVAEVAFLWVNPDPISMAAWVRQVSFLLEDKTDTICTYKEGWSFNNVTA